MEKHSQPNKGLYDAIVSVNKRLDRCFYRISIDFQGAGAGCFAKAKPGQFLQLDLSGIARPPGESIPNELIESSQRNIILRRPFSFSEIVSKADITIVDILYCVLGPATLRMTTLAQGDSISVIGPLGNGFSVPDNKKTALLVAGGMGAGPLIHLAGYLSKVHPGIETIAFVGAKAKEQLPFEKPFEKVTGDLAFSIAEFTNHGVKSLVATDDGSIGFNGLVTECFELWIKSTKPNPEETIVYSCGPEAMLAGVTEISQDNNIDCQVSMERMMACGIGVCQSCAIECKTENSKETVYKLCCKDGPVFDAKEVIFRKR